MVGGTGRWRRPLPPDPKGRSRQGKDPRSMRCRGPPSTSCAPMTGSPGHRALETRHEIANDRQRIPWCGDGERELVLTHPDR
jgi:hypothetical protein